MTVADWIAQTIAGAAWTVAPAGVTDVAPVPVDWTVTGASVSAWVEWPPFARTVEFSALELRTGTVVATIAVGATRVLAGNGHLARIRYDLGALA